jgi:hypothetical protein
MSIRIDFQKNKNKTLKKEADTSIDCEECTDWTDKGEDIINTPRQSEMNTNDLSKKRNLNTSFSRASKNHPSTTDKLSNNSMDSNFIIDKNFSPNETEMEFVIEECAPYKIRTPVKNDSIISNDDVNTDVGQFILKDEKSNLNTNSEKSQTKINFNCLESVVKNLNDDFNKIKIEFSLSNDSKQYILFL